MKLSIFLRLAGALTVMAPALALSGPPAIAQQNVGQKLVIERDWGAYVAQQQGAKVCFALSTPKDMQPGGLNRGEALFYVIIRPTEGVREEVAITPGYTFRDGSQATITIGENTFTLFTQQNKAFVENAATEAQLVAAMKAGSVMVVRGTSSRGNETTDQYSLFGVTAAITAATRACEQ
ncbi:MAG: invasion associated locus B family protein [Pseudomonadota bacterium]